MPARHTSLPAGLLSESRFLKIGSCRRKRVSARHQVKRLDRNFEGACSFEERSGRRNRFSSFGADLRGLQFHGLQGSNRAARFSVKSGPDVFADALVRSPVPLAPPGILYPPISQTNCPDQPRCASAGVFSCADRCRRLLCAVIIGESGFPIGWGYVVASLPRWFREMAG
jgi:hypothetical protein